MNKTQLIDALAARYEGNRKQAAHALESVLDTITREVARGEKVAITGFGSFEKTVRNARMVRNPQTGQQMKSKKKAVPKFTAGQELKNVISGAKKLPKLTAANMPKPPTARSVASAVTAPARAAGAAAKKVTSKAPAKKTSTAAKKSPAKKASAASATTAKKATTTKKASPAKKASTAAKKTPAKKTSTASAAKKSSTAKKSSPAKKATAKKS
ncbi:HU family DNA-binding protein [Nocardioides sp.]|uniref:HU family DNA-binding protein n=1 Tax=Nocardioides sp. TaxID=35761 RepID=UPI002BD4CC3A|nr:HU family DNA-binding protein [Nocardioides sp.]HXH77808.1 HU family DNA-binding protein [Nocardioides sp.]